MEEALNALKVLGFVWPSPAYIVGAIVFGLIGMATFRAGRRKSREGGGYTSLCLSLALMFFPYAVSRTWLLYAVGGALCAGLYFNRE
jgi:hypothetical protein